MVDRSGSMNGARLTTAAVTAAACLGRAPAEHAVLAFAADVSLLKALDAPPRATRTVEAVLGLRGHGTTALSDALTQARHQLARARARRRGARLASVASVLDVPSALAHLLQDDRT